MGICSETFGPNPNFTRCIMKVDTKINFSTINEGQTAIYLHNKNKGIIKITTEDLGYQWNNFPDVNPGEGVQIFLSNFTLGCFSEDCALSIWHTSYDKDSACFIGDTAGSQFLGQNIIIPRRYPAFFDFGENTKFYARKFDHPRDTGLTLYYYNNTEVSIIPKENKSVSFTSPGMIHMSSSKYTPVEFNIIIGSMTLLDTEFSNNASVGLFSSLKGSLGNYKWTTPGDKSNLQYINAKRENREYQKIALAMIFITILVFIISLVSLIVLLLRFYKPKKNFVDETTALEITDQDIVSDMHK
ncbi:hypothetical protein GPJ56_007166 [Histomonas meleagridis]|uniref:uncharacterized protein n=1 Tax=Histomonas meleagridis TaxID=135588 RepID=UPI003559C49C|nr:hypothetical protein GPJ56_007166 [Histomonas meleagridis]KAH0806170.1 hypothetical protein GO595_000858 [Histomonas meleagridis]